MFVLGVFFLLVSFWFVVWFQQPFAGRTHGVFKEIWELNLLLQIGVCFENARRNPCSFIGSGQLSNFETGWLIQTAILYAML